MIPMDATPWFERGSDELVAVYDAAGRCTGQAPRSQVYAQGLWHGSAGVLLCSPDRTRIYVHRRSVDKAVFAAHHDCLAGGVIDPGEAPIDAARRELAEELGVTGVVLTPLATVAWDGRWQGHPLRCHLWAFEACWDGPVTHQVSEIAAGWWWTLDELRTHLRDPAWPFAPDTRTLLGDLLRP